MLYGSMEKFFYLWLPWWLPVTKILFSVIDCAKYGWGLSPTNDILYDRLTLNIEINKVIIIITQLFSQLF